MFVVGRRVDICGVVPEPYIKEVFDPVTGSKDAVEQGMLQKQHYSAYVNTLIYIAASCKQTFQVVDALLALRKNACAGRGIYPEMTMLSMSSAISGYIPLLKSRQCVNYLECLFVRGNNVLQCITY